MSFVPLIENNNIYTWHNSFLYSWHHLLPPFLHAMINKLVIKWSFPLNIFIFYSSSWQQGMARLILIHFTFIDLHCYTSSWLGSVPVFFCMLSLLVLLIHTDVHAKAIKTEDMCICKKTKSTWYIVVQYVIIMLNMCCNLSCHRNDSCFTCTFDFIRTSSNSTEGWKCLKKGYILFIAMQFRRMHITYLKRISYLSFHWI